MCYEILLTVEVTYCILVVDYALIWIKLWQFALHLWVLWRLYWQGWGTSYLIVDICMEDINLTSLQLLEKIKHLWDVINQICLRLLWWFSNTCLFLCGVEFSVQREFPPDVSVTTVFSKGSSGLAECSFRSRVCHGPVQVEKLLSHSQMSWVFTEYPLALYSG